MTVSNSEFTTIVNTMTPDADAPGRPAAGDAGSAGSIDKVRDILFGNQVREFERRFVRLDERIAKELNDLKTDVQARLEALELYTRNEAESLAEQVRTERAERTDSTEGLSRELKDAAKSLERRTATLDEQLSKGQRELRQQMLEQHQRLSDDIRRRVDEVMSALAREAQELRTDKADRATLASLFTEMAMRLTNDFHLPDVEGARNG